MLSLACESFRYLIFPFYWQFIFIPLLPDKLLTCLQVSINQINNNNNNNTNKDQQKRENKKVIVIVLNINKNHHLFRHLYHI